MIAPIGVSADGQTYNINADTVAGALAGALKARRMLLLTDVAGVLDEDGEIVRELSVAQARAAIDSGLATGGMIPKLETAVAAAKDRGMKKVIPLNVAGAYHSSQDPALRDGPRSSGKAKQSPRSTARRIKPHPRSFGQQDESDDRQTRQRAYNQSQDQKYLVLTLLQLGHEI